MPRILIIDDEEEVRGVMEQTLKASGHDVFLAANGEQGLNLHQAEPMDLIITDLYMPEMEGLEFIIELRRQKSKVPILAVSGCCRHDALALATKFGAVKTLAKPFLPDQLQAAVNGVLSKQP